MKSSLFLLLLVGALAIVFRFSRNDMLQFWSDDEEIHAAVVQRMIVIRRPTLVSPQSTLGTSIGSFFHMASVPLFLIADMDPQKILSMFSVTGVLTTLAIYFLGKEIGGIKLGLIASFLYATSFLAGLYDRRWWPITWTPLLSAIGLFAAMRLVKSRHQPEKARSDFLILTAITVTALHGDPAMVLFGLFIIALITAYRIHIPLRTWIAAMIIVVIAASPLILFELRHPGTMVKPLFETLQRKQLMNVQSSGSPSVITLTAETTRWLFFPNATTRVEPLLYPINVTNDSLEAIVQVAILTLALIYFSLRAYRSRGEQPELFVITIYLMTFFLGIFLFTGLFRHESQRVYVSLLFPAFFIIAAWILLRVTTRRNFLLAGFLFFFLAINTVALVRSRYTYPLSTRQRVVKTVINALGGKDFSLYVTGDPYLESGGFTRLFILNSAIPKKSFTDKTLGWWYRTHSLYFTEPTEEDQDHIVIVSPSTFSTRFSEHVLFDQSIDTIRLLILDNESRWFRENHLGDLFET